jgi:hypothetical protein
MGGREQQADDVGEVVVVAKRRVPLVIVLDVSCVVPNAREQRLIEVDLLLVEVCS